MSASLATTILEPGTEERVEQRRRFTIVADRPSRSRPAIVYALVAVAGVAAVVIAQLLLSVAVSQGAYEIDRLAVEHRELERTVQTATSELERVKSPQFLAANAEALGMVQNANPVYLRLSDSAVLGQPSAADVNDGVPAGSLGLVPNVLLTGVPLVTDHGAAASEDRVVEPEETPAPPLTDGLPTPATR